MTEMSLREPWFFTHPTDPGSTVIRGRSPTLVQPHGRTATPKPTYEKTLYGQANVRCTPVRLYTCLAVDPLAVRTVALRPRSPMTLKAASLEEGDTGPHW